MGHGSAIIVALDVCSPHLLHLARGLADGVDDFARQGAPSAVSLSGDLAGAAVEVYGDACRLESVHSLCQERSRDSAQDVAGAGF